MMSRKNRDPAEPHDIASDTEPEPFDELMFKAARKRTFNTYFMVQLLEYDISIGRSSGDLLQPGVSLEAAAAAAVASMAAAAR